MELHAVKILLPQLHARHRTGVRVGHYLESRRHLLDINAMAHPADRSGGNAVEQRGIRIHIHFRMAVLADRRLLHHAVQQIAHQLRAVADSQHRNAQLKYLFGTAGSAVLKHHIRSPGENDPLGIHLPDLVQAQIIGMYLAVYVAFADAARNQLIVLAAKVQNNDHLSVHEILFLRVVSECPLKIMPFPLYHGPIYRKIFIFP